MIPIELQHILNPKLCQEYEGDDEIETLVSCKSKLILRDQVRIRRNAAQDRQNEGISSWGHLCYGCQVQKSAYKKECGDGCLYEQFQSKFEFAVAKQVFSFDSLRKWLSKTSTRFDATRSIVKHSFSVTEFIAVTKAERIESREPEILISQRGVSHTRSQVNNLSNAADSGKGRRQQEREIDDMIRFPIPKRARTLPSVEIEDRLLFAIPTRARTVPRVEKEDRLSFAIPRMARTPRVYV